MAETLYAPCGDLSLAYQVFGDGPIELVFIYGPVSHVELLWTMPEFKAFFDQLATFCCVVVFDKAGVGLSDPVPHVRTLDDRAAEIEAVMDAVGFGKAVLFAAGEGGPTAIVFAATRPERTRALVLANTLSFNGVTSAPARPQRSRCARSRTPAAEPRRPARPAHRRGAAWRCADRPHTVAATSASRWSRAWPSVAHTLPSTQAIPDGSAAAWDSARPASRTRSSSTADSGVGRDA